MPRRSRTDPIRRIAMQRADDNEWGIPESPEFSAVQRLMHEFQTHESALLLACILLSKP